MKIWCKNRSKNLTIVTKNTKITSINNREHRNQLYCNDKNSTSYERHRKYIFKKNSTTELKTIKNAHFFTNLRIQISM